MNFQHLVLGMLMFVLLVASVFMPKARADVTVELPDATADCLFYGKEIYDLARWRNEGRSSETFAWKDDTAPFVPALREWLTKKVYIEHMLVEPSKLADMFFEYCMAPPAGMIILDRTNES